MIVGGMSMRRLEGLARRAVALFMACCMLLTFWGPSASGEAAATVTAVMMEAEQAALSGGAFVDNEHPGYTGSGFVAGFTDNNKGTAAVTFTMNASAAGEREVTLRYANGTGVTMTISPYVNGVKMGQLALPPTSSWSEWRTVTETYAFRSGSNTLQYRFTAEDSGNVNLDHVVIGDIMPGTGPEPEPNPGPPNRYEAEAQFHTGGVSCVSGALEHFDAAGAKVVFTVNLSSAGQKSVVLRYAKSTAGTGSMKLQVNGIDAGSVQLPSTGGAEAWAETATQLPLRKGLNTITYEAVDRSAAGVRMDALTVADGLPLAERGATVPYQELEAETGTTNAVTIGPSRTYLTVEAESSGRQAVKLTSTGHYVEWTAPEAANALVVRYSMPDAPQGGGIDVTLSLYVNGVKRQTLDVSSRYAWTYGSYPYNDNPADGGAHHFYDESRYLVDPIPAGATVRLQKDAADHADYYTIDLINLEMVAPAYTKPDHFVSITDFGATANDHTDDTAAIRAAIQHAEATGSGVWIPAGTFRMNDRVNVSNVHIRGAGMWHTTLQGTGGKGGFYGTGGKVYIADLSMYGDALYRNDAEDHAGLEGRFASGSLIQGVWIEHMKVGIWLNGGTDGLYIVDGRVRNTWADGVNFHGGVKNTTISHFHVRNTGDDAFAMWSDGVPNENNLFRYNTAQIPVLANTFAIYGGKDNKVWDNLGADTVTASAGIAVSTRFNAVSFSGTTEIKRNTLLRTGGYEPNWNTSFGGLWIYAENQSITAPILIEQVDILDSTYEGVKLSYNQRIQHIAFDRVTIDGAGTHGIYFDTVTGLGTFSNVVISGTGSGPVHNPGQAFQIVRGPGNIGW
ncbi:hypothetical protein CHH75_02010 [Paenibacillus sp. 7541]|nr:hypothetical protein CHH75_02010 [Paenibacillus sp. 7541]